SLLLRQPPNLLLFVADQMRADHLGFYGNTVVRTPNIDGIAVTGLQFNKFSLRHRHTNPIEQRLSPTGLKTGSTVSWRNQSPSTSIRPDGRQ
ncbi:MAG TPA: hypothetical protein EYO32_12200, partial [Rhodospirillales bacterium]|nr:hypothetical protein [Rhodospirillales bacterium]